MSLVQFENTGWLYTVALFTSVGVSLAYSWVDIMLVLSVVTLMKIDSLKAKGIENKTI
jgi:hypothetical protein